MVDEIPEKIDNMIDRSFGSCVIQEKIAVGGFGTVYKAIDSKLDVLRAIKVFHPHLSEEKGFKKRFEIEMRLLAQLDHMNIVRIINAIEEPDVTGFTMEYVEGDTLADIVESGDILPIQKILDTFLQVAKSIAYAHNLKHQIIHRDLSPDNIMIRPDNVVKIMDFGIAKTIGSERVTQTGIVLGKPTYMAPEQFEGTVSIYTDQYALGIILYEMLTGRVPFDAESPIALYKLHLNEDPVPPNELNEDVPGFLNNAVLRTLAKDEKDRFKSMDDMIDMLTNEGSPTNRFENKIAPLMVEAYDAIQSENFEQALNIYSEILIIEPKNKEALAKREEVEKLAKSHQDQDLIEEWFHQAQAFYEASMEEEACGYIQDFLKLSRLYDASRTVQKHKGSLQKKMPDIYFRAEEIVQKEYAEIEKQVKFGKKLFQQDKFEEAMAQFDQALEIDPYNELVIKLKNLCDKKMKMSQIAANYRDGVLALKNEDYAKAIIFFDTVLELHPAHQEAKNSKELAKTELERIQAEDTEIEVTYKEAKELYEQWEFTRAIEKFQRVLVMKDDHESAKNLLEESLSRVDDENAMEEIGFFYNQGMTFYKGQQWEKAIKCYDRVLKAMENHKGALEYKKLAEDKTAQQSQVEDAFQKGLEYFRNSDYTVALENFDFILALDKNHKGARQYRSLCEELRGISTAADVS